MANKETNNFLNIGGMTLERFLTLAILRDIDETVKRVQSQQNQTKQDKQEKATH